MRRLLIATDGSDNSQGALRFALSLDHGSLQLHPCYVIDYANVGGLGKPAGKGAPDLLAREGRHALERAQEMAGTGHHHLTPHLFEGDRVDRLLDCAKRIQADAIVIGTRGKRGGVDRLFGSTTRGLFRRSTLPIITVSPFYKPSGEEGVHRILVGFDGSAAARESANVAYDIAIQWNAQIDFLYVVDYDRISSSDSDDAEALGAMVLSGAALDASKRGVRSKQYVLRGTVSETILKFVAEHHSDLVVLGTHGRTGFDRLIMGSIAEAVASESPVPVLVVRHVPMPATASA